MLKQLFLSESPFSSQLDVISFRDWCEYHGNPANVASVSRIRARQSSISSTLKFRVTTANYLGAQIFRIDCADSFNNYLLWDVHQDSPRVDHPHSADGFN